MNASYDTSALRPGKTRKWVAIAALGGYGLLLCVLVLARIRPMGGLVASFWELQDTKQLVAWLAGLALVGLVTVLRFVPVGFFVPLAMPRPSSWCASLRQWLWAILVSFGLAYAVRGVERHGLPGTVHLLLPMLGCLLGVWIGRNWVRGWRARPWLIPKILLLVLAFGLGGAALAYFALQRQPMAFEPAQVTSPEKRRLVQLIRNSMRSPHGDAQTRCLQLTETDIDLLLAWGLKLGSSGRKAVVHLGEGHLAGLASVRLPLPGGDRYLNVRMDASVRIDRGRLRATLDSLSVGRLRVPVPRLLLGLLVTAATDEIEEDVDSRELLASVHLFAIRPEAVELVYRQGQLGNRVLPSLLERLGVKPEAVAATREYLRYLVSAAQSLPQGKKRFGAFMEAALRRACEQSRQGSPITENRAAIFALAILLGHPEVERLVGQVADADLRAAARRSVGRVTIRGRHDWTRHFFVSAAFAVGSTETVSDAVGLLKEELDAGGGSGFSFGDLLADRAGTLFALAATRDRSSATSMQERLAIGFDVDDFLPPAADLPEGISDAELQTKYGGVHGSKYREIEREIERRLKMCGALR